MALSSRGVATQPAPRVLLPSRTTPRNRIKEERKKATNTRRLKQSKGPRAIDGLLQVQLNPKRVEAHKGLRLHLPMQTRQEKTRCRRSRGEPATRNGTATRFQLPLLVRRTHTQRCLNCGASRMFCTAQGAPGTARRRSFNCRCSFGSVV